MSSIFFLKCFVINYVLNFMLSEKYLLSENTMISRVR